MTLIKGWHKAILVGLLIAAFFLRFYNLESSLMFQGDQGRDAIIVADIFRRHDLVFIGPVTSVGNLYLGPLYYYFMLPFLWLSYPSPIGPVYAVAALGVLTVYLIYRLGKNLIGPAGALVAAFFYTFSAVITQISRFSWNPNPAPLVSLLMIYSVWLAWKKQPFWWVAVAACFSVLMQLHYLTLLSLPAAGLIWLVQARELWLVKKWKKLVLPTALAIGVFLISLTPLVLFDYKHQGTNLHAFQALFSSSDNFTYAAPESLFSRLSRVAKEHEGRGMHILFEYMIGKNRQLNQALLYGAVIALISIVRNQARQGKDLKSVWVLLSFLSVGIVGTAFYEHTLFDHYLAYLFPVTVLTYGYIFSQLRPRTYAWLFFIIFGGYFLSYNLPKMPLNPLGWQIKDIKRTSDAILERVKPGEKYNLVLLSESRDIDGQNYRYYLTTGHTRPVDLAQRGEIETLFIIDEEHKLTDVTASPIYEVVVFPDKKPAEVFNIEGGPTITVLRRTTQLPVESLE